MKTIYYKVVRPVPANLQYKDRIFKLLGFGFYDVIVLEVDNKQVTFWPQEVEEIKAIDRDS